MPNQLRGGKRVEDNLIRRRGLATTRDHRPLDPERTRENERHESFPKRRRKDRGRAFLLLRKGLRPEEIGVPKLRPKFGAKRKEIRTAKNSRI